jgi:hypothetical protein
VDDEKEWQNINTNYTPEISYTVTGSNAEMPIT